MATDKRFVKGNVMVQPFGEPVKGGDRTPTLRQYYVANGKAPGVSHVKTIFLPGKFGNWGLIVDHNFRVNFHEDSDLARDFYGFLEDWVTMGVSLVVIVIDAEKGEWQLGLDEKHNTVWEGTSFGYVASALVKAKIPHTKTPGDNANGNRVENPQVEPKPKRPRKGSQQPQETV